MLDYAIVCAAALLVSALTLFSGFGLGTLLMPVMAIFFPLPVAVAAAAVVHLANNLLKLVLLGRHAAWGVVLRFGIPAVLMAFIGAWLLDRLAEQHALAAYEIGGRGFEITPVKLVIAVLMIVFALFDLLPRLKALRVAPKYLPLGGALSGFFGGISGHQGALRSAFLIRLGLEKKAFIATGVVVASMVDVSRLAVYGATYFATHFKATARSDMAPLIVAACAAAFVGTFAGARLLKKVTIAAIEYTVGVMLILLAIALGAGWLQ